MTTDCLPRKQPDLRFAQSPSYRCDWPISALISGRATRGNSRARQRSRFFSLAAFLGRVNWHSTYRVPMLCSRVRQSPETLQSLSSNPEHRLGGTSYCWARVKAMLSTRTAPYCLLMKACIISTSIAVNRTNDFSRRSILSRAYRALLALQYDQYPQTYRSSRRFAASGGQNNLSPR